MNLTRQVTKVLGRGCVHRADLQVQQSLTARTCPGFDRWGARGSCRRSMTRERSFHVSCGL